MHVCPHTDRWIGFDPHAPIAGMRPGWIDRMIANVPKHRAARVGYLACLYALRAESMPDACLREADVARLQEAVGRIIGGLAEHSG